MVSQGLVKAVLFVSCSADHPVGLSKLSGPSRRTPVDTGKTQFFSDAGKTHFWRLCSPLGSFGDPTVRLGISRWEDDLCCITENEETDMSRACVG